MLIPSMMEASLLATCVKQAQAKGWNAGLMGWKHGQVSQVSDTGSACDWASDTFCCASDVGSERADDTRPPRVS